MRVAIIMPLAEQKGGAELLLLHLLKANRANPLLEFGVAFLCDGPMVKAAREFTKLTQVFESGRLRQVHRYLFTVLQLAFWLRRHKFDLVMSWMSMAHIYGSPASVLSSLPNVWWQHGFPEDTLLERITAWLPSRRTFCCSRAVEAAQSKIAPGPARSVIHPAVDLETFNPQSFLPPSEQRTELGLPSKGLLIGLVGRLQKWKGMSTFVQAAAELVRERCDIQFLIVGGAHALEPEYVTELVELVAKLGLVGHLNLVGYQSEPAKWMNACDVIVHASIKPEPFGMVILEAMALGKIVIASGAGGPIEIVRHGVNGFLTPPGDASALAEMIRAILVRGTFDPALETQARVTAAHFSSARFAEMVQEQLLQVISKSKVST